MHGLVEVVFKHKYKGKEQVTQIESTWKSETTICLVLMRLVTCEWVEGCFGA